MLQKMQEDIASQPLIIHCVSGIEGEADPGAAAAAGSQREAKYNATDKQHPPEGPSRAG